jgi:putative nucleotidyltransferase with HDIG domain
MGCPREPTQDAAAEPLLSELERKDAATLHHTEVVAQMAGWVAEALGLPEHVCNEVRQVARLHDVGKALVPADILIKPGPLTDDEWTVMRKHPEIGAAMLRAEEALQHLAQAVRAHHERWDGAGYPDGLSGHDIPVVSRIVSVCDAFHAMVSDRPYRSAMGIEAALGELEANAGTQLDPQVVEIVLERFRRGSQAQV